MTTFDFRSRDELQGGTSLDDVRALLAGPEPAALLSPATIGTQVAGQGAGIPMGRIRRGLLGPLYGRGTNYSITATTLVEVDSANLAGTLVCTGRPVIAMVNIANASRGTSYILVSVAMDGVDITGRASGGMGNVSNVGNYSWSGWAMAVPRPGPRRFALTAAVDAGTGTLFSGTINNLLTMAVVEL